MRIEKIICDRCGKEFKAINNAQLSAQSARIDLYAIGQPRTYPSQRIDLCEECYQEFISFLEK
jgi:hypothetical protein